MSLVLDFFYFLVYNVKKLARDKTLEEGDIMKFYTGCDIIEVSRIEKAIHESFLKD